MNKIPYLFLLGGLALVLVTAGCSGQEETPQVITISTYSGNPTGTTTPASGATPNPTTGTEAASAGGPNTPTDTPTSGTAMPAADIRLLDCQFCIDNVGQALLILPQTAKFAVLNQSASTSADINSTGCSSVDTFNGRQIVICRGAENTSLNLNICSADNNCQQMEVPLQSCPASQNGTPEVSSPTPAGSPTDTPTPAPGVTSSPTASATATATP